MAIESFSFDKGINRKKARLYLEDGELYSCSGFSYNNDGILTARSAKTVGTAIDITATSKINGIHRYDDDIYASSKALCPGSQAYFNYIYHRITGSHSNIDFLAGNTRPRWADYEKFVFVVDGESKRTLIDEKDYEWGVSNPDNAPTLVASGVASTVSPTGPYTCYYTYYITFPNEKIVETGPSPAGTITVSLKQILWSGLTFCNYAGSGLLIQKRLYRTVSGTAYLVTTIDNAQTTYTDNVTDVTLQASTALGTENYSVPTINIVDIAIYLQRIFGIKKNKLYWSEPYTPFSFKITSDVAITKNDKEDLVVVVNWGDQLYMASIEEWYRLQGTDPTTWAVKRTFTDSGIINKHTLKRSKYGLIGLWHDGIYLFDGSISRNITEKKLGRTFFTDISDLTVAYAEFDGTKYCFYYASSGTTINSCLVLDFAYYPDLRIYNDDFIADAHEFYKNTNYKYLVKGGYEYTESGTETIATSLITGDRAFQALLKRKCLDYLYYDLNSNGKDVSVSILIDGSSGQTLTLNKSSRVRTRSSKLKALEGYRFGLQITCADSQSLEIYSPWALEATPVGE